MFLESSFAVFLALMAATTGQLFGPEVMYMRPLIYHIPQYSILPASLSPLPLQLQIQSSQLPLQSSQLPIPLIATPLPETTTSPPPDEQGREPLGVDYDEFVSQVRNIVSNVRDRLMGVPQNVGSILQSSWEAQTNHTNAWDKFREAMAAKTEPPIVYLGDAVKIRQMKKKSKVVKKRFQMPKITVGY